MSAEMAAATEEEERRLSITISKLEIPEEEDDKCNELMDHLLYSIMLLLPLKTLLRFCCLSKYWQDTFRSRSFNLDRMKLLPSAENVVYCFKGPKRKMRSKATIHRICGNESHSQENEDVDVPFLNNGHQDNEGDVYLVSPLSCDGLLCVIRISGGSGSSNEIIIWNPYARQSRSVPWPEAFKDDCYSNSVFVGFGYDTSNRDYKIVVIKSPTKDSDKWQIQVNAFKTKKYWREVEASYSFTPPLHNLVHKSGAFRPVTVQEDIYWIGKIKNDSSRHILKFNLANETLTKLSLPSDVRKKLSTQITNPELLEHFLEFDMSVRQRRVQLGHRNNQSLYVYLYNAFPQHTLGSAAVNVWLYSKEEPKDPFIKVLSISEASFLQIDFVGLIRPLGFTAKGDFIMTFLNNQLLVAYIPGQDKLETVDDPIWPKDAYTCGFSLVEMESALLP